MATFVAVGINIISLIFPALFVYLIDDSNFVKAPLELGVLAFSFIAVNFFLLGFGLMYYKKFLPNSIHKSIQFIQKFEISKKISFLSLIVIIGIYILFSYPELFISEFNQWDDFLFVYESLLREIQFDGGISNFSQFSVKYFLLKSSIQIFDNVKIIPFLASITLLLLVYFFTLQITQKRFAALVSMVILLQSHLFLLYDTTATYSNFWIVFYLLSLILINAKYFLSPLAFVLSIFSKAITAPLLPIIFFFIFRENLPRSKKIRLYVIYLIVLLVIVLPLLFNFNVDDWVTGFDFTEFFLGFTAWNFQLRYDIIFLLFIPVTVIELYLISRTGSKNFDSIMLLILGSVLLQPLLVGFTDFNMQPYRFMPLLVFFAVGVGAILSKRTKQA